MRTVANGLSIATITGPLMLALSCSGSTAPNDGGTPDDSAVVLAPTYWGHIAPLLETHCTQCHTQGGIGPVQLTSYEQVRPVARLIANETGSRRMPPWKPDTSDCRTIENPRVLSADEIAMLARWADQGAPEGNRDEYVAPVLPPTARPLPPTGQIVAQPADVYTPNAQLTDDYHCFVIDPGLTATTDVVGVRVTPGNARILHHVILFEVREESLAALQALDDAEPGPGYTCFGSTNLPQEYRAAPMGSTDLIDFNQQFVVGWAPGGVPGYFPVGTGVRLKPNSRLVMQVHYNLDSQTRGMTDRSRVDLYTSETEVRQAIWMPFAETTFNIPAGASPNDPAATVQSVTRAPFALRVFGAFPHMHTRGYAIRADIDHANGTNSCLVNIPRWDFHWQQSYFFQTPYRLIAGQTNADTVRLTCTYDNTPANQPVDEHGVQQAPRALTWGEGTNDEMCLSFFYLSL